jgi:hypothetical protein
MEKRTGAWEVIYRAREDNFLLNYPVYDVKRRKGCNKLMILKIRELSCPLLSTEETCMGKEQKSDSVHDLAARLRLELPRLRQEYSVRALGLFGSYVRGEQKKGSLQNMPASQNVIFQGMSPAFREMV